MSGTRRIAYRPRLDSYVFEAICRQGMQEARTILRNRLKRNNRARRTDEPSCVHREVSDVCTYVPEHAPASKERPKNFKKIDLVGPRPVVLLGLGRDRQLDACRWTRSDLYNGIVRTNEAIYQGSEKPGKEGIGTQALNDARRKELRKPHEGSLSISTQHGARSPRMLMVGSEGVWAA